MDEETLNKIEQDMKDARVWHTSSVVNYSPLIKIALRLVIFWLRYCTRRLG